jgi:hypothetical protein
LQKKCDFFSWKYFDARHPTVQQISRVHKEMASLINLCEKNECTFWQLALNWVFHYCHRSFQHTITLFTDLLHYYKHYLQIYYIITNIIYSLLHYYTHYLQIYYIITYIFSLCKIFITLLYQYIICTFITFLHILFRDVLHYYIHHLPIYVLRIYLFITLLHTQLPYLQIAVKETLDLHLPTYNKRLITYMNLGRSLCTYIW